jgi:hypothetical protein
MFHNLGRLLSQYYFPEESEQIKHVIEQKPCSEEAASIQVLDEAATRRKALCCGCVEVKMLPRPSSEGCS